MDYPSTPIEEWDETDCIRLFEDTYARHPAKVGKRLASSVQQKRVSAKYALFLIRGKIKSRENEKKIERQEALGRAFSMEMLIQVACSVCDTFPELVRTNLRPPKVVMARRFCAHIAHEYYRLSYPNIAKSLAHSCNHSATITQAQVLAFEMGNDHRYAVIIKGEPVVNATGKQVIDEILRLMGYVPELVEGVK
jgi:hypothetical protein